MDLRIVGVALLLLTFGELLLASEQNRQELRFLSGDVSRDVNLLFFSQLQLNLFAVTRTNQNSVHNRLNMYHL